MCWACYTALVPVSGVWKQQSGLVLMARMRKRCENGGRKRIKIPSSASLTHHVFNKYATHDNAIDIHIEPQEKGITVSIASMENCGSK
jgi:hypothetical protein